MCGAHNMQLVTVYTRLRVVPRQIPLDVAESKARLYRLRRRGRRRKGRRGAGGVTIEVSDKVGCRYTHGIPCFLTAVKLFAPLSGHSHLYNEAGTDYRSSLRRCSESIR